MLKIYKTAKTGESVAGGALVSSAPDHNAANTHDPAAGGALVSSAPDYNAANTRDQPTSVEVGTLKAENRRLLVATADEWLEIVELQPADKKRMAARDYLNGFQHPEHFLLK